MTFEEEIRELLAQHGLSESKAQVVLDRVKEDKAHEAMNERWGDEVEDYPSSMLALLWLHTKAEALAYIDEVCPKVFYRSMFVRRK